MSFELQFQLLDSNGELVTRYKKFRIKHDYYEKNKYVHIQQIFKLSITVLLNEIKSLL